MFHILSFIQIAYLRFSIPYIINQIAHQNYQQNNYNQILKQTHFTKIHTKKKKKKKKEKKARGVNQIYSRITPTHTLQ